MDTSSPAPFFSSTERKIFILPIGTCEQHGPYLPVDTDLRIASLLSTQLSLLFPHGLAVLLPPIPYSCSYEHQGIGTLAITIETLSAYIHYISHSLTSLDVPALLITVNCH